MQVALALFKLCQEKLLVTEDMGTAIHVLREFETSLFDSDALLECATLEFHNVGDVNKMRQELLPGVCLCLCVSIYIVTCIYTYRYTHTHNVGDVHKVRQELLPGVCLSLCISIHIVTYIYRYICIYIYI